MQQHTLNRWHVIRCQNIPDAECTGCKPRNMRGQGLIAFHASHLALLSSNLQGPGLGLRRHVTMSTGDQSPSKWLLIQPIGCPKLGAIFITRLLTASGRQQVLRVTALVVAHMCTATSCRGHNALTSSIQRRKPGHTTAASIQALLAAGWSQLCFDLSLWMPLMISKYFNPGNPQRSTRSLISMCDPCSLHRARGTPHGTRTRRWTSRCGHAASP